MAEQQSIGFPVCKVNSQSWEPLKEKFIQHKLLHGERLRFLNPLFQRIGKSWNRAMESKNKLLREVSCQDEEKGEWASMSTWKTTNDGIYGQAIVSSSNNPLGLLKVMREQLSHLEGNHFQLWYEPTVKLNYNLFGPKMVKKLNEEIVGEKVCGFHSIHYLQVNPLDFSSPSAGIRVIPLHSLLKDEFLRFVTKQRGEVYVKTEELDIEDISLSKLDKLYQNEGMRRTRIVLLAYSIYSSKILGAAIIYRGPIGLNLSLLENKVDLMIAPEVSERTHQEEVMTSLLHAAGQYYIDFPSPTISVTTEKRERDILCQLGSIEHEKIYCRSSVIGGDVSKGVYDYYQKELATKERRFQKRLAASRGNKRFGESGL